MTPAPGSEQAQALGCTCPVIDNCYCRGYMGGVMDDDGYVSYVYDHTCRIHGKRSQNRRLHGYLFEMFPPTKRSESSETWDVVADLFTQE